MQIPRVSLSRRVGVGLIVILSSAIAGNFGCAHHAASPQNGDLAPQGSASLPHISDSNRPPDAGPPGGGAGGGDDTVSTANIVAQRVRDFTKTMQGAGAAAGTTGAPADPNSPAGALNTDDLRLSPAPPSDDNTPPGPPAPATPPATPASATFNANKPQQLPLNPTGPEQAADLAHANSAPDLSDANQPPALDPFTAKLEGRIHDDPQDVSAQLAWQLDQFVHGEPVPQLPALAPLDSEDRELLSAVLDALSNFNNAVRADPNLLLSHKVRPFLELADRLRNQAELVIPTIELCTRVSGFGVYDPIKPARFSAGKETKVILYCEVENFASQLNADKQWETRLSQDVVLYTEQNGLEVWRDKTVNKQVVDLSRNRRHDFFLAKVIDLPPNLTIGRYLLKVSVVDDQVKRVAENTIPIEIVAE